MKTEYFSFGLNNLRRRGVRSWLTLLGIVIGVTSVIALVSLGDGLKLAISSSFDVSSTQALTVQLESGMGLPGTSSVKPLTKQDVEAISKLGTVDFATPRNIRMVQLKFNDVLGMGMSVTVEEGIEYEMYDTMGISAEKGRMLQSGDLGKIVIGANLANKNKNKFNKEIEVGNTILINEKRFRVEGILKKGGSFLIDNLILIYDKDLSSIMDIGDEVDIIGVMVKSPELMGEAKKEIEDLLRTRRKVKAGDEDFEVSTPDALLSRIDSIVNTVQIFVAIIAMISVFVGAVGIINTMTTSVIERRKEIGIMKSIGAKNSDIFYQFFIEAGLLGLVGGIIGISIGLGIGFGGIVAINNFLGTELIFEPNWILVITTLFGGFIVGAISGISPAMNAARLNPVEALQQ